MTHCRSWKDNEAGSGESMTSTSWRSGGGGEEEELKQRTKKVRRGEVESEGDCDRSSGLEVRWEKFLPRMVLRVLLVEADDCTRQIIAALLRKCSYQVTAVPDGLKAWEILTGRPRDIDLILTEVELPSVSGYALLTLVMDHDICKKIPVIMMSTQDSIQTVYKCMLRGAADYLVKPIRRNELRNLWQHVWRRNSSIARRACPEDNYIVLDDEIDPVCENDAASKPSIVDGAFSQRNKEYVEKGNDSQDMHGKLLSSDAEVNECQVSDPSLLVYENQTMEKNLSTSKESSAMTLDNMVEDADMDPKVCESYNACFTGEEIDFMGAAPLHKSSHTNVEFDSSAHLDLSLRSSYPDGVEIQAAEGTNSLKHSRASSFTRYTGRQSYFQHSTSSSVSNPKEPTADSERNFSNVADSGGPSPGVLGDVTLPAVQIKEPETENSSHQKSAVQIPTPVARARINDKSTGYTSMFPPFESEKSAISPPQSPSSVKVSDHHSYFRSNNSERLGDQLCLASESTTKDTMKIQDKKLESLEDQGRISPVADQKSASSSFCDGGLSHRNSMGYGSTCGSNSDVDQVVMNKAEADSKDEGVFTHVKSSSTRSAEREAALAKFRLKRKERCYDKKVRYESRKTLAEQRPRVKGQFVRQVPAVASTFRT
ncbi:Two-component response regulator-like APRR5 [Linum perenne]